MYRIFIIAFIVFLFIFCKNEQSQTHPLTQVAGVNTTANDSTLLADLIHQFYQWYDKETYDTTHTIDFVNNQGKYLRLDTTKLMAYLAYIKESGFVSDVFIQGDIAFYKECEKYWQHENKAEVPSCLDADKYFCAQDWEINKWTSGPIKIVYNQSDSASVKLLILDSIRNDERNIQCHRINGKWLISKIECDMGQNGD